MQRIKILHIAKMKGVSGSENHLLTLLPALDPQRFDLRLCILAEERHLPFLEAYKAQMAQAGVTVFFFLVRKDADLFVVWKLWRYLRRNPVDIVHTHLIHADLYGTLAAKLAGVPAIISSRHNDDQFRRHPLLKWGNRQLARQQAKIIVISDWVGAFLREVERIPAEKIVRIYYGMNPETMIAQADPQYVRRQFQIPDGVPVIGTIGQLRTQKGHSYFLEAIKQIVVEFPSIRALILGEGELRGALEQQIRQLDLEQTVILAGYRTDAVQLLAGFDVFVFPSLWEGFGLVLLEAMALRKPIIASRVSAIPEIVLDGETGILTPPQNPAALASAITHILTRPDAAQSMGAAGYARLHEHFTVQTMVERTEQIYQAWCSSRR